MTTISALELRKNLKDVLQRVQNGEEIAVTYRGGEPIKMTTGKLKKEGTPGLDAFLAAPRKPSPFPADKSFKELYHEHLEEKYGNHEPK